MAFVVNEKPEYDPNTKTMIEVNKETLAKYDELASQSNRSRNELIQMALDYALSDLEFKETCSDCDN